LEVAEVAVDIIDFGQAAHEILVQWATKKSEVQRDCFCSSKEFLAFRAPSAISSSVRPLHTILGPEIHNASV
jgi:hypothetical protein